MRRILQVRSHVWNAPSETHQDVMRKEPVRALSALEYIRRPTKNTPEPPPRQHERATQCERPMAHSVGFNIPAAKCDCTAKQTMQHTKTHTQEREKKKENSAGCFLYTIYLFLCVCALRVWEIWNMGVADGELLLRVKTFWTPPYRNFLKLFQL